VTLSAFDVTDRVRGCILGGAVGDALGAPFEGLWSHDIPCAAELMEGFAEFEGFPRGQYTDDTQLTVATVKSIVRRRHIDPADIAQSIARLWRSQAVVGPCGACTAAADALLAGKTWMESGAAVGQAGNGTAMRTAAVGLYFLSAPDGLGEAVAQVSRITHHDPRSVAGGVAIASAARILARAAAIDGATLCRAVADDMRPFDESFADLTAGLAAVLDRDRSTTLDYVAWSGGQTREFDEVIITPYVVPTVLASLWAVCSHPGSWTDAVAAAIGLGGDVDSLGAIVGGLMGARLGHGAIPAHLVNGVLDSESLFVLGTRYAALINSGPGTARDPMQ
jgi:ADP-ribosylglycohydrolase